MNDNNSNFAPPDLQGVFREGAESLSPEASKEALMRLRKELREAQNLKDHKKMAWSLVEMAMVLRGQRQYPAAQKILEESRTLFGTLKHSYGLAVVFNEMAFISRELDRNAIALEYSHQAIKLFQELGRTLELGWAYDNLAVIHLNLFHYAESLAYAKKARAVFLEFKIKTGLGWNACNLAFLYFEMGFPAEAEKLYLEASAIFFDIKNSQGQAWSQLGLATVYRAQCLFDECSVCVKKAKVLFQSLDMKDRVGWCLLHDAAIKRTAGEYEEAMLINRRAIQLFGPLKSNDGVSWGLFQIARIFRDQGQLVKAWQMFRDAVNLQTDISNKKGIGWAQNDLGETYLEFDDTSHAKDCLIKAKAIADQLDNAALKIDSQKNLARLFIDEGQLRKASGYLDEVDVLCQKGNARETQVEAFFERVRYFMTLGDHQKAEEQLRAAEELIGSHGLHRFDAMFDIFKAEISVAEGDQKSAVRLLESVLDHCKKSKLKNEQTAAALGLIQLLMHGKKNKGKIMPLLVQVEKDIRVLNARRYKAKLAMVKGLVAYYVFDVFEPKNFDQAIQIAQRSGLQVLEKQFLDVSILISQKAGDSREQNAFQGNLGALMEREGATDLYLVKPRTSSSNPLQISLVI